MFTVIIEADTNDADYIQDSFEISDDGFVKLSEMCAKIKDLNRKHSPRIEDYNNKEFHEAFKDVLTFDEIEQLCDMIPKGEYGYATLESIKFFVGSLSRLL